MGNALAGKRRVAKVMTVDGATSRYKTPATAAAALRGHPPGHRLLESGDVRRLGVRARPLDPDAPLKPGKLYFLVHLPPQSSAGGAAAGDPRAPGKTWSGELRVGARERLESLMLSRRTVSDMPTLAAARAVAGGDLNFSPAAAGAGSKRGSSVEVGEDGAVRLRMRLPKAEVARLMEESRDAAEAAERIMKLCVARDQGGGGGVMVAGAPAASSGLVSAMSSGRKTSVMKKEKRTRFVTMPDEIMG